MDRKFYKGLKISFLATMLLISSSAIAQQIEMTLVQGGSFKMGDSFEGIFEDELPVHEVTLSDFFVSTYEITQNEWETLMGENPSQFKGGENPVESISWFDAVEFCNKLSEKHKLTPCYTMGRNKLVKWNKEANGYRLLTEAEWEYIAKGGNQNKGYVYAGSNSPDEVAWYKGNSLSKTHPVGMKMPNEIGLFDVSGNIWEWCWDWYTNSSYSDDANKVNPSGVPYATERCRRGGGWAVIAKSCRNSNRLGSPPHMSFNDVGVRIARNAE